MRERTSVTLDPRLRAAASREAKRRGVSLSALMTEALAKMLGARVGPRRCTMNDLVAVLEKFGPLPDEYVAAVREGIRSQGEGPVNRWDF